MCKDNSENNEDNITFIRKRGDIIWDNEFICISYLGFCIDGDYWHLLGLAKNKTNNKIFVTLDNTKMDGCIIDDFGGTYFCLKPQEQSRGYILISRKKTNQLGIKDIENLGNIEIQLTCQQELEGTDLSVNKTIILATSPLLRFHPINYVKDVLNEMSALMDEIKMGETWNEIDNIFSQKISFKFEYPSGKRGDVDFYLVSQGGTYDQVSDITYRAHFIFDSMEQLHILELIVLFRRVAFSIEELNAGHVGNEELIYFMDKYNKVMHLYNLSTDAARVMDFEETFENPVMKKANEMCDFKYHEVKKERDKIYEELIKSGNATGRWKNEQRVFAIAKNEYNDTIYQYKPSWLEPQSLDVYIPSLNIGIEYQGMQHYKPIKFFGGETGFEERQELDKKKKRLCEENGVKLIYWNYNVPVTEDNFKKMIESNI